MIDIFGCLLTNQIMSRSEVENFTQIVFVEPIKEDERANPVSFHRVYYLFQSYLSIPSCWIDGDVN